jgi:HlyD family secretion protein
MKQKRKFKWWLILPVVALVIASVIIGRRLISGGQSETDDLTQVFTATRGDLVASVSPTGEVYAPRSIDLNFDVTKVQLIELNVNPGQLVKAGEILARIETSDLERAVQQAEADLTIAEDDLDQTRNPYSELDLIQAQLTVSQTEVSLLEAQAKLDDLLNPDLNSAWSTVQDAATSLETAKAQLTIAENSTENAAKVRTLEYERDWYRNHYWEVEKKYNGGDASKQELDEAYLTLVAAEEKLLVAQTNAEVSLTSAQNKVTQAQESLQTAQENYAALKNPEEVDKRSAQNQVTQADYNLAKARETLANVEAGPSEQDIELAEAKVVNAQAKLEEAQEALDVATMVAPFDGTVVSVGVEVGDFVSSGDIVVALTDLTNLRILATVDETDIGNVEIGQKVDITFDAFPGYTFSGEVLEVPLQGNLMQNVLTYDVPVSLEGPTEIGLKPGMTANLTIVVGQRQDVLLVPVMAIMQGESGDVVLVQDRGGSVETPVQTGLTDGSYVEVVSGLIEGDNVVVQYEETSDMFGGFGMGFGVAGPQGDRIRQP